MLTVVRWPDYFFSREKGFFPTPCVFGDLTTPLPRDMCALQRHAASSYLMAKRPRNAQRYFFLEKTRQTRYAIFPIFLDEKVSTRQAG